MSENQRLRGAIDRIWTGLDAAELEPAAARRGDAAIRAPARQLWDAFEAECTPHARDLESAIAHEPDRESFQHALAHCAVAIAGVLWVAGDDARATAALSRAEELAPQGETQAFVRAAALDLPGLALLLHAQWLMRHERRDEARRVARQLVEQTHAGELAAYGEQIAGAPDSIQRAPALFTLNGFGTRLYGQRDARADGSYVATRYVTALYVPVFPLDAYLVSPAESGHYFHGKVPLARGGRLWQKLAGAGAVVALLVGGGAWYTQSDGYRLDRSLADAARAEAAVHDARTAETAVTRYQEIFDEFHQKVDDDDLEPIALAVTRLETRGVPARIEPSHVDQILRGLSLFTSYPESTRGGKAALWVEENTLRWANSLGSSNLHQISSALRLVNAACVALGKTANRLIEQRQKLQLLLARELEREWPLAAIDAYACAADDPAAAPALERLLNTLPNRSFDSLSPELEDWIQRGAGKASADRLAALRQKLEAQRGDASRKALLEAPNEAELRTAIAAHPDDAGYALALAAKLRADGNSQAALETLDQLGKPGVMPRSAAFFRATVLRDLDRLREAETIYEHLLLVRLPTYEATSFRATAAVRHTRSELWEKAARGELPEEIRNEADEDVARQRYGEWVEKKIAADSTVVALQQRLEKLDDVITAAVALGMLRLELAGQASGKEKEAILARAESTFLSIRGQAEGLPDYHLGLGTVYHRLGKREQGDEQFASALRDGEPRSALRVARAYRDLGQETKARSIAERIAGGKDEASAEEAAALMSLLVHRLEEREAWLLKSDQTDDYVRATLLEVQAERAFEAGDLATADQKYRAVYDYYAETIKLESSSANNAALALSRRYACTGETKHLADAVRLLEAARRLAPDIALVLRNIVGPLEHLAQVEALEPWFDMRALRLTAADASIVLGWMARGPHGDEVLARLRRHPRFQRAREANRQARVLAPSSLDTYGTELGWAGLTHDSDTLRSLLQQIKDRTTLDRERAHESRAEWLSGAHDAAQRKVIEGSRARYARTLQALSGPKAAASRAALLALMADDQERLSSLDASLPAMDQALSEYRRAVSSWPDLGLQRDMASALVRTAVVRVIAQQPNAADLKRRFRSHGPTLTVAEWLERPDGAPARSLKAEPLFGEAVNALVALPDKDLTMLSFLMGQLAGHTELTERSRRALQSEGSPHQEEVSAALSQEDTDVALWKLKERIVSPASQTAHAK